MPTPTTQKTMTILPLLIVLWLASAFPVPAETVAVERVIDGDTIVTSSGEHIRLYGIDAPEMDQPYGPEARDALAALTAVKIRIERVATDRYGRTIAMAWSRRRRIASEMVASGAAWMYRKYCRRPSCAKLKRLEAESKQLRRGLWGSKTKPIPPWKWRKR